MFFLLTLVSGVVIGIYVYFTWHFDHWAKKGIPGPNARFFFGNFPSNVTQSRNMFYDADDIYQKYRDKFNFVGFYHMRAPGLMALNPETIKEILVKKFKNFHDNEFADMGDKDVDRMFSRNPFMLQGEEWKEKRAEITPAFTPARIKTIFPVIEDVCQRMKTYVIKNNKDAIEVREMCAKYATDVVSSSIFGLDAESFTKEKPLIREMGIKLMNPSMTAILYFILIELLPFMSHVIKMPFVPKEVENFFVNLMKDAIAVRKKNKIERVDFLNYLLELQERKNLAEVDMAAHAVTFFLDGFETSSVAMSYALYELSRNSLIQDKLREEIKETELKHGKITFDQLLEMPYLDQVMMETLRRRSPAILLSKKCTESCELELIEGEPKTIDKGISIMIPVTSIHMDPLYYENPEEFDPERFSAENGGTKTYREKGVFIPFGDGPRACLGQKFALTQVKAGIVDIIKNFELMPNSKTEEPIIMAPGEFTSAPVGGLWLHFKELS